MEFSSTIGETNTFTNHRQSLPPILRTLNWSATTLIVFAYVEQEFSQRHMIDRATYLTREGLAKLQEELKELKNVKRKEIADRIQQAKELGDLSENAEYVEAKNEQAFIEGRILMLENMVRNAVLVEGAGDSETVQIGSTVTVESDGTTARYTIVGSNEADPANGRVSNESPLGNAFLGKRTGDSVTVETPSGKRHYTIQTIE